MRLALLLSLVWLLSSCLKDPDHSLKQQACDPILPFANTHTLDAELQSLMERAHENGLPGISVSIHSASKGSFFGTFGKADLHNGIALSPCHTLRAASFSKTLMATAFIQLHDEGKIDLESPISDLLPVDVLEGLDKANETSIAELLNHTSGIPNYDDNSRFVAAVLNEPGAELSTHDRLNFAKELGGIPDWVIEKFGYIYSNTNYLLLELILEATTGEPYDQYLDKHILQPTGMFSSSFGTKNAYPESLCVGYCDMYDNGRLREVSAFDARRWSGEAALISNTSDMYRFFEALLQARLTSAEGIELMKNEQYGLLKESIAGHEGIGHDGLAIGYSSQMWHFPDMELTVILMANQGRISGDQESIAPFERLLEDIVSLHRE